MFIFRLLLAYKQISFETVWIEYSEVERVCKEVGGLPTSTKPNGDPHYTVPFIKVTPPAGSKEPELVISDSTNIASYIEQKFPGDQPLIPPDTRVFQMVFRKYFDDVIQPTVYKIVLEPYLQVASEPKWFEKTREELLGMPLAKFIPKSHEEKEEALKVFENAFDSLAQMVDDRNVGNYRFMNGNACYAEIVVVASLYFLKRVNPEEWSRFKDRNQGIWEKLLQCYAEFLPKFAM